jgi:hypothetical protein
MASPEDVTLQPAGMAETRDMLVPTISYWALTKAVRVLTDIVSYYFPLHGLSHADLPRFAPVFTFAESTLYQIDEEYETHIDDPHFTSRYMVVLRNVLTQLHLYDEALDAELQGGLTYWRLEQQLCSGKPFTEADIVQANRFRCCDYRFLHRLLHRLLSKPYNEELFDLCWLIEQMGEVEEDLLQYQDDLRRNVYNTYRLFVRLYGQAAPQHLQRYRNALEDETQQRLVRLSETQPALAATVEHLYTTGRTLYPVPDIPVPILDPAANLRG